MCWNEHVSLNTWLFSIGVLALMIYNNAYTPYRIAELDNPYVYFFILSFCTMQLLEYFLWRNIDNRAKNKMISWFGQILVMLQPVASLMLLKDASLKIKLITVYALFVLFLNLKYDHDISTKIKNGHLQWNWISVEPQDYAIWVFFLSFSFIVNRHYFLLALWGSLFAISYFSDRYLDRTAGSLWCWSCNVSLLVYLIYLLVYMPFREHGIIC
jgi:hypothetical protein